MGADFLYSAKCRAVKFAIAGNKGIKLIGSRVNCKKYEVEN